MFCKGEDAGGGVDRRSLALQAEPVQRAHVEVTQQGAPRRLGFHAPRPRRRQPRPTFAPAA
ncbi:MAG: hypothetical protein R2856_31540 [Caldilineaceae bacterium]